jgi:hypothetical protein
MSEIVNNLSLSMLRTPVPLLLCVLALCWTHCLILTFFLAVFEVRSLSDLHL